MKVIEEILLKTRCTGGRPLRLITWLPVAASVAADTPGKCAVHGGRKRSIT